MRTFLETRRALSILHILLQAWHSMPQTSARSGPGRCAKCSKTNSDVLDHIHKRHRDQRFHQHEITGTGLELCPCGKVVLNRAGLIKHQIRYGCWARQGSGVYTACSCHHRADSVREQLGSGRGENTNT